MPIQPPSFKYGGNGSIMSAAIGAALAKNNQSGNSLAQQRYLQKKQQSFLSDERELDRVSQWILGMERDRVSGKIIDPSAMQTNPALQGRTDIRTGTSQGLGLMPGLTPRDLERMGVTEESLRTSYLNSRDVARAEQEYSAVSSRFEREGLLDPTTLNPRETAELRNNPVLAASTIRADPAAVEIVAKLADDMDMPDFAADIRAEGDRGVSENQLSIFRTRINDRAGVEQTGREETKEELAIREDWRAQQTLDQSREWQDFQIGEKVDADVQSWTRLYYIKTADSLGEWLIDPANGGAPPPPDRRLSIADAQLAAAIARDISQTAGNADTDAIIRSHVADPMEAAKFKAIFDNYVRVDHALPSGGGAGGIKPPSSGKWTPTRDAWTDAAGKVAGGSDFRSNTKSSSIRTLSQGFRENPEAWKYLVEAFPPGVVEEDIRDVDDLDALLWQLMENYASGAGASLINDIWATNIPSNATELVSNMINGSSHGVYSQVPTVQQLQAYRAVKAAKGESFTDDANWGQILAAAHQIHTGLNMAGQEGSAELISAGRAQLIDVTRTGAPEGQSYNIVGGGELPTRSGFVDERLEELVHGPERNKIESGWSGNSISSRSDLTFPEKEAFEVARLWKSWYGNKGKQEEYVEILTAIVDRDYNGTMDLLELISRLKLLTDRGDYKADEKYRKIFDHVSAWVSDPVMGNDILGWETRFEDPLRIALQMIEHDNPDPSYASGQIEAQGRNAGIRAGLGAATGIRIGTNRVF